MWVTVCRHRLEDAEPHSDEESGKQEPEGEEEEEGEWAPCTVHSHFILTYCVSRAGTAGTVDVCGLQGHPSEPLVSANVCGLRRQDDHVYTDPDTSS